MSKTLLIFLFSQQADPYINSIAYNFDHNDISAVRFIYISGTKTGLNKQEANQVFNNITSLLNDLANECYRKYRTTQSPTDKQEDPRPLEANNKIDIYRRINEKLLDKGLVALEYGDLHASLDKFIKQEGGVKKCIVDLTPTAKAPSIDIFSICLALGLDEVYVFELSDRPSRSEPEKSLYHSLDDNLFSYTRLTDSPPVKDSKSKLVRRTQIYKAIIPLSIITIICFVYLLLIGENIFAEAIGLTSAIVGIATLGTQIPR